MPNTVTTSLALELIDELKEMASGRTDAARLGEIAAMAAGMDDAGTSVEASNLLGMVAALRGDTFEVERRFNAALQRGGNDAWTLGNYAAALNILATGLNDRKCEAPDIAERKRMESELRLKEAALDLAHDAVYLMDIADLRFVYVNEAASRTLGYSREELLDLALPEIDPYLAPEEGKAIWETILVNGSHTFETRHRRRDGSSFPVEIQGSVLEYEGRMMSLSLVRDITERKQTSEQLVASQKMLADAQKLARLGSWDWDVVADRVEWSEVAYEIYTPDKRPAEPGFGDFTSSLHPDDLDRVVAAVRAAFERDEPFDLDHRVVSASRGVRTVHAQGKVFRDASGKPVRMVGTVQDITERQHMERELRLKEFVLDQARIGVYLIGDDARITYVNDAACRALGYSREELLTKTTMDINVDSSVEASMAVHRKVLDDGFCTFETMHVRRDGSLFPVEVWASAQEYQGKTIGVALAVDITERKRMEAELVARERDFHSLAENMPDNVARWDAEGRILYSNPTHQRTLGKSADELIGKKQSEVFPDGRFARGDEAVARIVASGKPEFVRETISTENGEMAVHDISFVPEFDESGRVVSVLGLGRDMTEFYRMQESIVAREREFRSLAENMPDNVARWDAEGRILYSNPTHQRTLGKPFDEMVGRTLGEIFPDGYFAHFEEALARVVATGTEEHLQRVQARTPDGGTVIHDVRLTPEFDAKGRVVSVLGLGRDMTEFYRMQEALSAREREFRSLAENSPDNIARWDVEGRYLYLNPTYERTLGASAGDIVGTVISSTHFHVKAGIAQVAATGQSMMLVRQTLVVRGKLQIHEVKLVPECDSEGRIVGVLGLGRDMTDVYLMQEALAAREREFRSLAENSSDNIARYDCALRIAYLNPALAAFLRVQAGDVIGKHLLEAFPGEDFSALADKLIQVIQSGIADGFYVTHGDRGQGERIHHLRITPERDELGEVVSVLVIGRDMTDIYRMQEAVAEREQEFRSLAESSPDSIIRYDLDQRILYLNNGLVRGLGLASAEEVIGRLPVEVWPDGRFAAIDVASKRVIESGNRETIELVWPGDSGNIRVGQILVVPEYGVDGRIIGTLAFGRDISEVKDAQRRMTDFVANFPGFAYTFRMSPDGHGSFPFASPGIEKLYGLQPADVKDDMASLHALAHPDDAPRIIAALAESARTMSPAHVEYRVCRPGLPERWVEFRSSPLHEASGSVVWHGIMLDIDERKRAEQALEDSRTQLRGLIAQREEAREEERRYIAREIHDNLGQILSGLRLNVSRFARRHAADSADMQDHLRGVGELVDLAVKEVRNISAALRPAELDMDIRSALASHLERFGAYAGIACELRVGDDVDLTEEAHKLVLFRIVQESLTNVTRHAQADKVEISLHMEPPHCVLRVRDDGIGFDTGANKPKSFGLVGMRERVAMLGGSVIIDSKPGKGTEITVRIPVKKLMEES